MNRDVVIGGVSAKLSVSGDRVRFASQDGQVLDATFSCIETSPGTYSVILGGRVHRVTLSSEVMVNGKRLEIEIFDPRERRANSQASQAQGAQRIASPMPGKVVRVLVAVGEEVTEGQGLVVVEAMKMQNEIKSPKAGRVSEVRTQADATVTAGQVLMVVE